MIKQDKKLNNIKLDIENNEDTYYDDEDDSYEAPDFHHLN